jgi:hypothetical protein
MRQYVSEEQATPEETEKLLKKFLERNGPTLPINQRIRDANHNLNIALLNICDLLDREWGKWLVQPGGDIQFASPTVRTAFTGFIATTEKSMAEEKQATQEFLAIVRASDGPRAAQAISNATP